MKTLVVLLSVYQSDPKQTMPFASMEENACTLVLFQWLKNFGVWFSGVHDSQLIRILSGILIIHMNALNWSTILLLVVLVIVFGQALEFELLVTTGVQASQLITDNLTNSIGRNRALKGNGHSNIGTRANACKRRYLKCIYRLVSSAWECRQDHEMTVSAFGSRCISQKNNWKKIELWTKLWPRLFQVHEKSGDPSWTDGLAPIVYSQV